MLRIHILLVIEWFYNCLQPVIILCFRDFHFHFQLSNNTPRQEWLADSVVLLGPFVTPFIPSHPIHFRIGTQM